MANLKHGFLLLLLSQTTKNCGYPAQLRKFHTKQSLVIDDTLFGRRNHGGSLWHPGADHNFSGEETKSLVCFLRDHEYRVVLSRKKSKEQDEELIID